MLGCADGAGQISASGIPERRNLIDVHTQSRWESFYGHGPIRRLLDG